MPNLWVVQIYALRHPVTKECRYVGASRNPALRLQQHGEPHRRGPQSKWVHSLRARGLEPELVILDDAPDDWREAERGAIVLMRACGHRLLNLTDGGEGGYIPAACTPEARAKAAASSRGRKRTPEQRERIRAGQLAKANPYRGGTPPVNRGEQSKFAKLTEAGVVRIREMRAGGVSGVEVARQFSITPANVSLIVTRKAWIHVP